MRKLVYCPCGCGARVRAALPPAAARLRVRLNQEAVKKALDARLQAYETQMRWATQLALAAPGGSG